MASHARGGRRRPRGLLSSDEDEDEEESIPAHDDTNENPATDASLGESSPVALAQADNDRESQVLTQAESGLGSQTQQDEEFLDILMDLHPRAAPDVVSEYYSKDFANVPERLRNVVPMHTFDLPMEICEDVHNVISPDPVFVGTMASASKSFIMIRRDDPSHYVQPYEGAPFTFVDKYARETPV